MRTRAVSSLSRAHSILLTCLCTSSVREARKPLRDNNHGQTASHLCQEFWNRVLAGRLPAETSSTRLIESTPGPCLGPVAVISGWNEGPKGGYRDGLVGD
jgi:hypothetical protein